ncbi:MAG: transporter [Phycisphaerales bacterium]|nr:transporter [Phycisphaerales bacterium]MCB9835917.1 transporter [Phycisphaera sp.]
MRTQTLAATLLVVLGAAGSAAQDGVERRGGIISDTDYNIFGQESEPIESPFATDRARTRTGVFVVPVGRFSIEGGATYTYDDEDDVEVETVSGPELLVRAGIVPRVEGRLGWTGFQRVDVSTTGFDDATDGITDMNAGVKVSIFEQNTGIVPAMAAIVEVNIPIGDDDFTTDRADPSIELAFDYNEIHEIFGFSGSVKVTSLENQTTEDDYIQTGVALSFDQRWDEEVETFLEYFTFVNSDSDIEDTHFAQAGAIFKILPQVTVDVRIGIGLTNDSTDVFAGAGGSVSF